MSLKGDYQKNTPKGKSMKGLAKQQGEVSLKDVPQSNGEKHLYDDILKLAVHADDDPPLILGWKRVHEFVEAINDANNQAIVGGAAAPSCPFRIPDPLTRESFKEALLDYTRAGIAGPFGTACLPCTPSECSQAGFAEHSSMDSAHHYCRWG